MLRVKVYGASSALPDASISSPPSSLRCASHARLRAGQSQSARCERSDWLPTCPSVHLMTEAEIDEFMDDALAELEEIRIDAKKALAVAASD